MKNSIFARFARAFFIFWHFEDVLVLSTTWNDLFCSCVDDVSIWWQLFNFVFIFPKRWFQFNSRIVRTHFSSKKTLKNWKIISETRSYIFRLRSRFRRGNHASRAARILPNIWEVLCMKTTWNHQIWGFDDNISMQLRIFHSLSWPEIPRSNSFLEYFA